MSTSVKLFSIILQDIIFLCRRSKINQVLTFSLTPFRKDQVASCLADSFPPSGLLVKFSFTHTHTVLLNFAEAQTFEDNKSQQDTVAQQFENNTGENTVVPES